MSQGTALAVGGLLKFYSKDELRRYMKSLIDYYQAQNQFYGDQLGGLLRTLEQDKLAARTPPKEGKESKSSDSVKAQAKGWAKMGTMLVNVSDPSGAMAEVLFQLHEEAKGKLGKSTEALKSYEDLNSTTIPEAGLYYLQVRNGVPERIVVHVQERRKEGFSFSADFQLV